MSVCKIWNPLRAGYERKEEWEETNQDSRFQHAGSRSHRLDTPCASA